jgi:hypothetical protein
MAIEQRYRLIKPVSFGSDFKTAGIYLGLLYA